MKRDEQITQDELDQFGKKKTNTGKKTLLTFATIALLAGGIAYDGATVYQAHQTANKTEQLNKQNNAKQNAIDQIQKKLVTNKTFVAQNSPIISDTDNQNMSMIQNAFTTEYTYTNADEYHQNWTNLHNVITDANFFGHNGWYPEEQNNGNANGNTTEGLHLKALCLDVQTYKADSNQYLAIAKVVYYHNSETLSQLSELIPLTHGFIVNVQDGKITKIQPVQNWGLIYSNQG